MDDEVNGRPINSHNEELYCLDLGRWIINGQQHQTAPSLLVFARMRLQDFQSSVH